MSRAVPKVKAPTVTGLMDPHNAAPPPIPDHQLLRRIGGGSYGAVWLARSMMGTYRAIKIVYRASFEHERPFQREFEGIQKFEPISRSHAGLVDILQVGRNDPAGYFYYVMELADTVENEREQGGKGERETSPSAPGPPFSTTAYISRTLKSDLYRRGRLPLEECLRLGLSLTDALGQLHHHGLIHRDIKPSNIIFVQGVPKLADIGLVAAVGQTVSFVGTEGFIPPEGPGTPQADLYSLGKVLYEISTGKDRQDYPEPLTNLATLREHEGLLELNEVILKACATDARKRYQYAQAMHDDLRLVQNGKSLRRLHAIERRLATAKKLGAIVATLALLAGGAYFQASRAERKATERLVRIQVANAVHLMDEGNFLGALPWIAESLKVANGNARAEEMHRYRFESVRRQCPRLVVLCLHDDRIHDAGFSPDGRRFVTSSADHTARVWDSTTGELTFPPLRHDDEVIHASFSPDGRRIVTASHDGVVRIWNAAIGEQVCPPLRHTLEVRSARFSPDSRFVVTASGAIDFEKDKIVQRVGPGGQRILVPSRPSEVLGEAQVWDAATGNSVGKALRHADRVHEAIFSPDGRRIVTASEDHTAAIWDATTWELIGSPLRHDGKVRHAVFSPDGSRVLTASEDKTARLWDATTGQPIGAALRHANGVLHAAFSPDGRSIVTTSRDQTACLWDTATGQLIGLPLRHKSDVWHAEFSPDGRRLVTAGSEPVVRVWEVASGKLLARLTHNNSGTFAAFSPDGRRLVSVSRDRIARLWDMTTLSPATLQLHHDDAVLSAEFSRDARRVLTASADQTARVWDAATGQAVSPVLKDPRATNHTTYFNTRFSPDGSRVVAGGTDAAYLFDATSGELICPPLNHARVRHATFSQDGRRVVTASGTGTARVWDAVTGHPMTPPLEHGSAVWVATFSPNGRWLVTGCGDHENPQKGAYRVWDALTGEPVSPPVKLQGVVRHACFSPDNRLVLAACTNPAMEEREAQLWNWRSGKEVAPRLRHGDGVRYAEFSPDGHRILTASFDKTARIWDAKTGEPLTPALKHDRQVECATFSPDGLRVVTASSDGTARVWDAATGEPVSPPLEHADAVGSAQFSPDGRRVATASEDHTARIWNLPKTERPVRDLLLMAGLLSGQQFDHAGGLFLIPPEELYRMWQGLRIKYPDDFSTASPGAIDNRPLKGRTE